MHLSSSSMSPTLRNELLGHVSTNVKNLTAVLNHVNTSFKKPIRKHHSSNGALNYALEYHNLSAFDLFLIGEDIAKKLKWVGPKVWDEIVHMYAKEA